MKGILFKPDMIQAVIEGRKTQTRRVIKPQPKHQKGEIYSQWYWCKRDMPLGEILPSGIDYVLWWDGCRNPQSMVQFARYQVGETVYIKEAWSIPAFTSDYRERQQLQVAIRSYPTGEKDTYDTDYEHMTVDYQTWQKFATQKYCSWQSPLFMPEWAARHFLTITGVRAERLQEINLPDCEREGFALMGFDFGCPACDTKNHSYYGSRIHFAEYWNSINPKYLFESNPWVFAYTFRRRVRNDGPD